MLKPELINSVHFKDERGYLVKPSVTFPNNDKIKYSDVYVSQSKKNVFRGLHYQAPPYEQEKIFTVVKGCLRIFCLNILDESIIFDYTLMQESSKSLYVPKGFATGILGIKEDNAILYCSPQEYQPNAEKGFSYLKIPDLRSANVIISHKDKNW